MQFAPKVQVLLFISITCTLFVLLLSVTNSRTILHKAVVKKTFSAWGQGSSVDLAGLTLSVSNATAHYAQKHGDFCNKCDFSLYKLLLPLLPCCSQAAAVILTGGVNHGALVDLLLQHCPAPAVHGFEIQTKLFEGLQIKYSKLNSQRVVLNNKGLSDDIHTLPVASGGEAAGLYTNFRGNNVWNNNTVIETTSLAQYAKEQGLLNRVCLAIIDVEGHEAKAIQGMRLMQQHGVFPVFAYELGGTWADSRNPSTWSQASTAVYLTNLGYRLFLMGSHGLLSVDAAFFKSSRVHNEGFGHFVQGNVLAVHESVVRDRLG